MRERAFVSAFHGFLDTIREVKPDVPILVVSPIYCGPIEASPGPLVYGNGGPVSAIARTPPLTPGALSLGRVRQLLESHVDALQKTDSNLHYLDGLTLFTAADAHDLPDALHPNTAGYARIAERFLATMLPKGLL
jgi:hypothetical protein